MYGAILTDGEGRTLYMFTRDSDGESVCYDDCAQAWPPLTVDSENALEIGADVTAEFGTIERDDGSMHVTTDGMPLYYFVNDQQPGDSNGMGVNNAWFLLRPDGSTLTPTVSMATHETLGEHLTDAEGRTLYMFTQDSDGESACYDDCAQAWPPLTVASEEALIPAATITTSLATTERRDGSLQVTANGHPLYYFVNDQQPGDVTGQEVGPVWFVLRPDGSVLTPTVSTREHPDFGEILTDARGRTLYMFTQDEDRTSACYGECTQAWPPLTVDSEQDVVESVQASVTVDTIERDDGSMQVTANGMPLYYFANDDEPGDANGHGLNDAWFVLQADGSAVPAGTTPTATPTPTSTDRDDTGGY